MKVFITVLIVVAVIQKSFLQPLEDASGEEERFKRSLYTDTGMALTGMEKISKRSIDEKEEEDMDTAATNVFLPAFARRNFRRSKRSADLDPEERAYSPELVRGIRSAKPNQDDMEVAATNAFLPAFAFRRSKRSVDAQDQDDMATAATHFARRNFGRSKRSTNLEDDDMDTAATNAFLPAFARRNFRRSKRSANVEDDDMDTAATNAFLPAFARRNFRRSRRSANVDDGDMETAATNAFLPAFARRNFRRSKRSANVEDDMDTAATNAFLPSFARRNIRRY